MPECVVIPQILLCVSAGKYPASLQRGGSYLVIPDDFAATKGFIRVIDESGEDYLYPRELFATADTPGSIAIKQVLAGIRSTSATDRKKSKFHAGYLITKGLRQFVGKQSALDTRIRGVRPQPRSDGAHFTVPRPR